MITDSTLTVTHWVHNLSPYAIRFSGSYGIRYYGLAYALGFLIAIFLLRLYWRTRRSPLNPDAQSDLLTATFLGVLLGGRIGYFLFYAPNTLLSDPLSVLRLWDGGMSSHGGMLGIFLGMAWLVRRYQLDWRPVADILVTLAPPGLLLGRLANFINGELWGTVSQVRWAVIFPASAPAGTAVNEIAPRHPSQLYEAFLEGVVLMVYTQLRFWKSPVTRRQPGRLAGEFLILYALVRALGELFREPDAARIAGMNRGIFYSLFLIVAGVGIILYSRRAASEPAPGSKA